MLGFRLNQQFSSMHFVLLPDLAVGIKALKLLYLQAGQSRGTNRSLAVSISYQ